MFVSTSVFGGQCNNLYIHNTPITVPDTKELCNSFYVVAYSGKVKGPIVSFERFNGIIPSVKRKDAFRPDARVVVTERADLGDYLNSGYDRGHMTPAADASTSEQMRDTFLLTNMTPQSKRLNEVNWRLLESAIRDKSLGITYVATGAIYGNETLGKNKIGIPVRYYKVIWYPDNTVETYYADNKDNAPIVSTTLVEIVKMSGIKFQK